MAEKASAERVAADMRPADFRKAVQRIRSAIYPKKDKISSINGEIAAEFEKVESFKVNKKAARIFMMLDKLEPAERHDIFQGINGLADAAGWDSDEQDLVDSAEGNVVPLRFGQASAAPADAGDDGEGAAGDDGEADMKELETAIAEPAPGKRRGGRKPATGEQAAADTAIGKRAASARDAARAHLGGEAPFTGDNSDLTAE